MSGFLVIVSTFIVFFAVAFRLLFSSHPCVSDEANCFNEKIDADDFDDTARGLVSFPQALLTMFSMGLFGAYSVAGFGETASPALTTVLFGVYMGIVTVVALNALIAILGGSFDQAQDMKTASRTRQRAELIVEYFNVMPSSERVALERSTRWVHQLVPKLLLESRSEADEWQGRLVTIKNELKKMDGKMDAHIGGVHQKIDRKVDAMTEKIDEVNKKAHGLLKTNLNQQTMGETDQKIYRKVDDTDPDEDMKDTSDEVGEGGEKMQNVDGDMAKMQRAAIEQREATSRLPQQLVDLKEEQEKRMAGIEDKLSRILESLARPSPP